LHAQKQAGDYDCFHADDTVAVLSSSYGTLCAIRRFVVSGQITNPSWAILPFSSRSIKYLGHVSLNEAVGTT